MLQQDTSFVGSIEWCPWGWCSWATLLRLPGSRAGRGGKLQTALNGQTLFWAPATRDGETSKDGWVRGQPGGVPEEGKAKIWPCLCPLPGKLHILGPAGPELHHLHLLHGLHLCLHGCSAARVLHHACLPLPLRYPVLPALRSSELALSGEGCCLPYPNLVPSLNAKFSFSFPASLLLLGQ